MAGHPAAVKHAGSHAPEYHFAVYVRLVVQDDTATGRAALKDIRSDLLAGRMAL